jgi:hypothetical protein
MSRNIRIILKCRVDDPSLIRIHRLQEYRSSRLLYLHCNVFCKILQRRFSAAAVILGIKLDAHIRSLSLVYHKGGQILK